MPLSSGVGLAASLHALSARDDFAAVHDAIEATPALNPVEAIVVLRNLAAVGHTAPKALGLISERIVVPADACEAFPVQIAQHYLDDAQTAIVEAAVAIERAVNALASLVEDTATVVTQRQP